MRCPAGKKYLNRIYLPVLLLICLAFIATGASAATRGVPTTTTSPFGGLHELTTAPTPVPTVVCQSPCSCMERSVAVASWGEHGFLPCSDTPCAFALDTTGTPVAKYCFQKKVTSAVVAYVPPVTTTVTPLKVVVPSCPSGKMFCYGDGCVDLTTDGKNCGECGHSCDLFGSTCTNGQCTVKKEHVYVPSNMCGGQAVDLQTDTNNCGTCGIQCKVNEICRNGACTCKDGWGICNASEGCHDLQADWTNCGACGNVCPGMSSCTNGFCKCDLGMLLCGTTANCIDVSSDPQHCGSCSNVCEAPETCVQGSCGFEPACGSKNYQTNTWETCTDNLQNQDETGVDCGGKCAPCNTKCTTGTKYAPPDTPCTSVYHYTTPIAGVPSSNYPDDTHFANALMPDCPFCNYPCRANEVCHPALDPMIEEALKCCSQTNINYVNALMPEPDICKYAIKMSQTSCQKCTGIYLSKQLADGTRWMSKHQDAPAYQTSPAADAIRATGGEPPYDTANYLLNMYHTGNCGNYATVLTTLLRKAGYALDDVGGSCDGAHCYNVVRFPGDIQWQIVDADAAQANTKGGTWEYGKYQGLNGYPYCHNIDETSIFYNMHGYNTTVIPDLNAYWNTVNNGQVYNYQHAEPFNPLCHDTSSAPPCSIWYPSAEPLSGPAVAGMGKDNWNLPAKGIPHNQVLGC